MLKIHKVESKDHEGITHESIDHFNLTKVNVTNLRDNNEALGYTEGKRRADIANLRVFANLIINGQNVATTKSYKVEYPSFEAEICEMFQVHVFTMPESIYLEMVLVDGVIHTTFDKVELEVPGQHVRTLTSASAILQQLYFDHHVYLNHASKDSEIKLEELTEEVKKEREKKERKNVRGDLVVKVQWQGSGAKLPPLKHENLFKKPKAPKNRI